MKADYGKHIHCLLSIHQNLAPAPGTSHPDLSPYSGAPSLPADTLLLPLKKASPGHAPAGQRVQSLPTEGYCFPSRRDLELGRERRGTPQPPPCPPQYSLPAKSCKTQLLVCTSWTGELDMAKSSKRNKTEHMLPFVQPGRSKCLKSKASMERAAPAAQGSVCAVPGTRGWFLLLYVLHTAMMVTAQPGKCFFVFLFSF